MNYEMSEGCFVSSSGINNIAYYNFRPHTGPRAVVQITHGMNESIPKYAGFIDFLARNGIAAIGHDHLGHGASVQNKDDCGFFASADGYKHLIHDLRTVTEKASGMYPGLPLIIFAHSMGTFVTRLYMTEYANQGLYPSAVVLCGTSGPMRAVTIGIAEASHIAEKKGERYRSKVLDKRMRAGFDKHPAMTKTAFSWLTRDEKIIEQYLKDGSSRFIFTASAFRDLFTMLKLISEPEWYLSVPKDLPMYLISGKHDPVGQFGRGVKRVYNSLREAGVKDVRLDIYPDCRHELINELNRGDIFNDIYRFICDVVS